MTSHPESFDAPKAAAPRDGFDILDACHRQTVFTLGKLAALVARLASVGADAAARELAVEILRHFSTTARQHHEDEERHVFPKLATSPDPDIVQAVLRLQQDHHWLDQDWRELSPLIEAVARGQTGYDLDALREGAAIFTELSREHIALEESIIYPQARAALRVDDKNEMRQEMSARRREFEQLRVARKLRSAGTL